MPIYDYINVDDDEDVLKDEYFKTANDAPGIIIRDKKNYLKAISAASFSVKGFNYKNGYS